jgi:hypothetical protein
MARTNSCLLLLSTAIFGASMALCAQTSQSAPSSPVKELPLPEFTPPSPFAIDGAKDPSANSIRIIPEDAMTREDRDLLAGAESSIQERAGVQNFDFNSAGWTYHQLVCPALPNHLFVRFTRDDGTRQMSMFSAAIPRDGNGRVRIIPIVRRGYSLFSPAPIGALTIAAFNRIREEDGAGTSADWLGTGLCYAALAGANPNAGEPIRSDSTEIPSVIPPTLTTRTDGGAIIRFADVSATPRPMEWALTFDSRGKLLKAAHTPAAVTGALRHAGSAEKASQEKP